MITPELMRRFLAERLGWHPFEVSQGERPLACSFSGLSTTAWRQTRREQKEPLPGLESLTKRTLAKLDARTFDRYERAVKLCCPRRGCHVTRAQILVNLLERDDLRRRLAAQVRDFRRALRPGGCDTPHGRLEPQFARGAIFALRQTYLGRPEVEKLPRTTYELFGKGRTLCYPPAMFDPYIPPPGEPED